MKQETIIKIGRMAWGICLLGKGIQQLIYGNFDAIFLPSTFTGYQISQILVYPWAVAFLAAGIALPFNKRVFEVSVILGAVFLIFCLFIYVPYMIYFNPRVNILFEWAPLVQELGFAGSSFAVAASCPEETISPTLLRPLKKIVPYASLLFSCPLIVFGIDHFLYANMISKVVPGWIPNHLFWTYFAGGALIAAGLAITFKIQIKLAGCLLALMIFSWLLMMHIPRSIITPPAIQKIELSRVFVTIGYTGIALLFVSVRKLNSHKNAIILTQDTIKSTVT